MPFAGFARATVTVAVCVMTQKFFPGALQRSRADLSIRWSNVNIGGLFAPMNNLVNRQSGMNDERTLLA